MIEGQPQTTQLYLTMDTILFPFITPLLSQSDARLLSVSAMAVLACSLVKSFFSLNDNIDNNACNLCHYIINNIHCIYLFNILKSLKQQFSFKMQFCWNFFPNSSKQNVEQLSLIHDITYCWASSQVHLAARANISAVGPEVPPAWVTCTVNLSTSQRRLAGKVPKRESEVGSEYPESREGQNWLRNSSGTVDTEQTTGNWRRQQRKSQGPSFLSCYEGPLKGEN